jgi:hypothetical protein
MSYYPNLIKKLKTPRKNFTRTSVAFQPDAQFPEGTSNNSSQINAVFKDPGKVPSPNDVSPMSNENVLIWYPLIA